MGHHAPLALLFIPFLPAAATLALARVMGGTWLPTGGKS